MLQSICLEVPGSLCFLTSNRVLAHCGFAVRCVMSDQTCDSGAVLSVGVVCLASRIEVVLHAAKGLCLLGMCGVQKTTILQGAFSFMCCSKHSLHGSLLSACQQRRCQALCMYASFLRVIARLATTVHDQLGLHLQFCTWTCAFASMSRV